MMTREKSKSLQNKFISNLLYGGIKKEEYKEIEGEILERDRNTLAMISICLMLMFECLFVGSLVSEMMAPNRWLYGWIFLIFMAIHAVCSLMKRKIKKIIIPLWYVAMTMMFTYAIILNTVLRNDISATTFCLIMMAAPLLVMDKPWRMLCYFMLVLAVFIPVDFQNKAYYLAYTDTVNALCSLFLGTVIHMSIIRTKTREIMQRHFIEMQRDTDKLTGCVTKAAFEARMKGILEKGETRGTFLVMDIDHFKNVNDYYGHVFGDMVLHTVGEKLHQIFPKEAMCGRFGGDEFQIWIPEICDVRDMDVYLKKLLADVCSIQTPDERMKITLSIGGAVSPDNGDNYFGLFENADAALYSAKNMGRNRYVFCPRVPRKKIV